MILAELVLASSNEGKLDELRALLAPTVGRILSMAEVGVASPPEPHATFIENALAKARHVAASCKMAALADDSGICVAALAGAPGVRSARFAAAGGDEANNDLLLARLAGAADRSAHYHCSLVLCRHADDPAPLIGEGRWQGAIGSARRGANGFGYDPLFELADGRTAAELEPAEKNRISHRARALGNLLAELERA